MVRGGYEASRISSPSRCFVTKKGICYTYSVPRATLQQRVNGNRDIKPKLGRKPAFTAEDETKLVDFACNRAQMGVGFGKEQFLK